MKSLVRREFALFLCIGFGATALHVAIATYLVGTLMLPIALGNSIAFVLANLFSYFSQSTYVFQRPPTSVQYWRFVSISLVGLAFVVAISSAVEALGIHYLVSIGLVVLIVPIVTFGVHSVWTFRKNGAGEPCYSESSV